MALYVLEHKLHSLNRRNKHSVQLTPNGLALAFYSTLNQTAISAVIQVLRLSNAKKIAR